MDQPFGFEPGLDHDAVASCAPGNDRLRRISALLGCDVGVFLAGAPLPSGCEALADTSELIDLWAAIPKACDRDKLLALARELAPV